MSHSSLFFFADDWRNKKASELLSKIPEGRVEANKDDGLLVTRAVSQFEADPDLRVQSLIAWAQGEVGRLLACIPNFAATSVEKISPQAED
jgi:hypothetical protein